MFPRSRRAHYAALHDLNASRVGVITPYLPEIGARFVDYLEAAGFVVTSQEHLEAAIEVGALCPESFGEAAAKVRNGSDAIAIPRTAVDEFKIRPALAGIEQPIVFANRATLQQAAALVGEMIANQLAIRIDEIESRMCQHARTYCQIFRRWTLRDCG